MKSLREEDLRSVEALLTAFGRCADARDGDSLAALFLAEGTMTMGPHTVTGRAAIATFSNDRYADPARRTRHVWSNLFVEQSTDGSLLSRSIQQTFDQSAAEAPAQLRVSDLEDTFRRDAAGQWRFASRVIRRVFTVG